MIFDCLILHDELDLLELRLRELDRVVDRFVVVEATSTFRGQEKPLHLAESRERFAPWRDRVKHVITGLPDTDPWQRETAQRNAILHGLQDASPDDLVVVSDADEIPRASTLAAIGNQTPVRLLTSLRYYFLDLEVLHEKVHQPVVVRYGDLTSPQQARTAGYPGVPDGGWHASFLGGVETIQRKLRSYAHSEHAHLADQPEEIGACIREGRDLFGRGFRMQPTQDLPESAGLFPHLLRSPVAA
jgi:beta-1,4-mannosyl-glycoprotein beta-1,4-N-acetylglucosaminyltransferase